MGSTGASQTARGPGTRGWAPRPRGIPSLLTPGGPHTPAIPELIRSAHQPIGASHSRHTRKAASPAHVPAASPRHGFAGPRAAPNTPSLCLMGSPGQKQSPRTGVPSMHTERLTPRGGKARPGDGTCRGNGTLAFRERPTTRMNPNIHSSQTLSLNPVEQSFSRSEKAVEPSPRGILVLGSCGVPCPGPLNRSLSTLSACLLGLQGALCE